MQNKNLASIEEYRQLIDNEQFYEKFAAEYKDQCDIISQDIWKKLIDHFLKNISKHFNDI